MVWDLWKCDIQLMQLTLLPNKNLWKHLLRNHKKFSPFRILLVQNAAKINDMKRSCFCLSLTISTYEMNVVHAQIIRHGEILIICFRFIDVNFLNMMLTCGKLWSNLKWLPAISFAQLRKRCASNILDRIDQTNNSHRIKCIKWNQFSIDYNLNSHPNDSM